jgi:glycosyltransferase involved in cell wall biosynthesis
MKILALFSRFSYSEASTYAHEVDLLNAVAKRGHEVYVLTQQPREALNKISLYTKGNLNIYYVRKGNRFVDIFSWISNAIRLSKGRQVDVIYGHITSKILLSTVLSAKITGRPSVIWYAGASLKKFKSIRVRLLDQLIENILFLPSLRNCNLLITGTYALKRLYVRMYGVERRKIRVVPNFIDTNKFSPRILDKELKSKLKISDEDFVVIFVGSLAPRKGIENLLAACKKLDKQMRFKLLIVGGHFFDKNEEQRRLKYYSALAKEQGVEQTVIFTGSVANRSLPYYINISDVLILPSLVEGFPRVLVEAMACEKPVIATNLPGISEMVRNGENGLLIEPGNVDDIAKAITFLYNNKEKARHMGKKARETVEKKYSLDTIVISWLQIYREAAQLL